VLHSVCPPFCVDRALQEDRYLINSGASFYALKSLAIGLPQSCTSKERKQGSGKEKKRKEKQEG
jgi:hypothetical protein